MNSLLTFTTTLYTLSVFMFMSTILFAERSELKHRQVKHFGYEFKYGINDVDVNDPLPQGIPKVCSLFLQRALATGHVTHYPDQLTVNQYQPGQGEESILSQLQSTLDF